MGFARTITSALSLPLETVKDQSPLKAKLFTVALVFGHPFYYWAWTALEPQPYDSAIGRASASLVGLVALGYSLSAGVDDRRTAFWYGLAVAWGTVGLGSWLYVANGGNSVWLASLCALTLLFFTITDWRFALVVTAISFACAAWAVPHLKIGIWQWQASSAAFDTTACLVIGFSLITSVLSRYSDVNMRGVQIRSQMRALAVTAHEIRTPIAGMLLLSEALQEHLGEMLLRAPNDDVRNAQALAQDLVSTCRDANALVGTHLANANPMKPFATRVPVAMAGVAKDAIEAVQRASGRRGLSIALNVSNDFVVLADPLVLRQVLVNLLDNARKAVLMRHRALDAGRIRIDVNFAQGGRVTVSDDGIGIASSRLQRIFKPFYTGDPDHGHGLGLTFVDAVAKAYGANLEVQSVEGSGTSFTLEFREARAR